MFLSTTYLITAILMVACRILVDAAFVPTMSDDGPTRILSDHKDFPRGEIRMFARTTGIPADETRRGLLLSQSTTLAVILGMPLLGNAQATEFTRETKDFGYSFVPPPNFESTNKPLKTHLDEINFVSSEVKGYQIGITVDPVRISSLREFGTPEEVAARVVTAEVNRDGVFNVTLVKDPVEKESTGGYEIDYLSSGKRGDKHFIANILVKSGKLYVVTGQVKEENYKEKEAELLESVRSFRVAPS